MTISSELYSAILAMDAYSRGYDGYFDSLSAEPDGIKDVGFATVVKSSSFVPLRGVNGQLINDQAVGFFAVAYDLTSDGFADVVSFRGTNDFTRPSLLAPPLDVFHGWSLGLGNISSQQGQAAVAFYNHLQNQSGRPRDDLVLTGHSLGGGLAGFVASLNGEPALIYDSMEFFFAARRAGSDRDYANFVNGTNSLTSPLDGIKGYFVNGEALSIGNSILPPFSESNYRNSDAKISELDGINLIPLNLTSIQPDDLAVALLEDAVNETIARHSQPALILALFEREFYETVDLSAAKDEFWPLLFDDTFAQSIGMDASNLNGALKSRGDYSDILRSITAYSALDEGERPFGDTAIRALYDDASDLSDVLRLTGAEGLYFQSLAPDLAKVFVNFAAQLARHDVEQADVSTATDGVLNFQINSFGTRFSVDLSFDSSSLPYATTTTSLNDLRDNLVYQAALYASGATTGETVTFSDLEISPSGNAEFGQVVYKILPGGNSTDTLSAPLGDGTTLYIGADGGDRTTGSTGDDLIVGGSGNDVYRGGSGNDTLIGGDGGDDALRGGLDNDVYVFGNDWGNDFIDEEGGVDTLLFTEHSFSDIRLQRNNGQNSLEIYLRNGDEDNRQDVPGHTIVIQAQFAADTSRRVEFLEDADGQIIDLTSGLRFLGNDNSGFSGGTEGSDFIETFDGDDVIRAGGGDDFLDGGEGNDTLFGSFGSDTYIFGPGFGEDEIIEAGFTQLGALSGADPEPNIDTIFFQDVSPYDIRIEGSGILFTGGVNQSMTIYVANAQGDEDYVFVPRQFVNFNPESAPLIERIEFSSGAWISTVRGVSDNTLPVGTIDTFTTEFETLSTFSFSQLLLNDSDVDLGDQLNVLDVSAEIGGTTAINGNNVEFTPDAGFSGLAQFTYLLGDGFSAIPVDVFVEVGPAPPNNLPLTGDDGGAGFSTDEDTAFTTASVLGNDTDVDGDALTVSALDTTGTLGLVADNGDGTFDYDPNGAFESLGASDSTTDSFSYTVSDGQGGTDTATVTVTVNGVNDDPVANDNSDTTAENTAVDINVLANDTDVEGDTLTVSAVGAASDGTTAINPDGTIRYTPNAGFDGTDSFSYTVSDGNGGTDMATVSVTVSAAPNQPPVVSAITAGFDEDQTGRTVNLLAPAFVSDPDGDDLDVENVLVTTTDGRILSVATDPETGLFSLDNGQFEDLADGVPFNVTIDYDVTDGIASTANTATVTITGANDDPVTGADGGVGFSTDEATAFTTASVLDNDTDVDGDTLSVSGLDTTGTLGLITDNGDGTFDYDPNGAFGSLSAGSSTIDSFRYTVSDGNGGTAVETVSLTITATPDTPVKTIGTGGDDNLIGTGFSEDIDALAGDDVVDSRGGVDRVTLGSGSDALVGEAASIFGDTLTDFSDEDRIIFEGVDFERSNVTIGGDPVIISVDTDQDGVVDGSLTVLGDFSSGDFMAVGLEGDTTITFETFLPTLQERQAVDPDLVNGIINQSFLTGDGSSDFQVSLRDLGFAGYDNVVGVYEIDADGNIIDTRILFENANTDKSAAAGITDVEAGNRLGFFIVQDAADWAATLVESDVLSFVNASGAAANLADESAISIAVNGIAVDEMVFHSFSEDINSDGVQHALSGVDVGGEAITVGFEDLTGGGDRDYEDVVFRVEIVDDFLFV